MESIALTIDEIGTLVQMSGQLSAGADGPERLESVLASLQSLVPFTNGVLLHEFDSPGGRRLFKCDLAAPASVGWKVADSEAGTSLERCLTRLDRSAPVNHAFGWIAPVEAVGPAASDLALFGGWMLGASGVGGCVTSARTEGGGTTVILCSGVGDLGKSKALIGSLLPALHGLFQQSATMISDSISLENLTVKEAKVMHWVVEGKTSWEVGRILSISERTVKFHLANIYSKLNVANRVQAVSLVSRGRKAAETGLYRGRSIL